jgi:thiopeptide-type bacteriocin biosynthesis protein
MNYKFHGIEVLRTPLRPFKSGFTEVEIDRLFESVEIQESLFLSSPALLDEYQKWKRGDVRDRKKIEGLYISLLKYALRMHTRCTPFGLFAGCNAVTPGKDFVVSSVIERKTRLDMNYTCELVQELGKIPSIFEHLRFFPNSSIYQVKDKVRYIEYSYKNKNRRYQISAVDSSKYLLEIIDFSNQGKTISELCDFIIDEEISYEDAYGFVEELIRAQLLINNLEPSVSGEELLDKTLKVITEIGEKEQDENLHQIIDKLTSVQKKLVSIDHRSVNSIHFYKEIEQELESLQIPFERNKLFQTDLFPIYEKGLDRDKNTHPNEFFVQSQIKEAITVLNCLTSRVLKNNLSEFKEKFYERYEDQEIPLLKAIDSEIGIGYGASSNNTGNFNPLIDEVALPYKLNDTHDIKWSSKKSFLFQKLLDAKRDNKKVVALDMKELKDFKVEWDDLPKSFGVMYNHLGDRNGKDFIHLLNAGGSSGVNLIGRFAQSNLTLESVILDIAKGEDVANPNEINAEIVHLPENRTGNILLRPTFRKYEIPFLSSSSLPKHQQIELQDLHLSVRNGELYLRSKRLNKRVHPFLGNAHNFDFNALPVYQVLCDLQTQNIRGGLYFDWGPVSGEFHFLPRVEVNNVVVFRATWQLDKQKFPKFKGSDSFANSIKKWRTEWEIPETFFLVEGDNELLIDSSNELSLQMMESMLRKKTNIVLKEFLFDLQSAKVKDALGNGFTNEFITVLEKEKIENTEVDFTNQLDSSGIEKKYVTRNFSVGSEWLYYKVYSGIKSSDRVLKDVIYPLTEMLLAEKIIDSWFFIRYADPNVHTRIRFHFSEVENIGTVIKRFELALSPFKKDGVVWKVQADTYKRELERYGSSTMLISEQLFYYDSKKVVSFLNLIEGDLGEEYRWRFAFLSVESLLDQYDLTLESKMDLMYDLKEGFGREFEMQKSLKIQLDKKYRELRPIITELLFQTEPESDEISQLIHLITMHRMESKAEIEEIKLLLSKGLLEIPFFDFLASHIHMLLNRIFSNRQRFHELMVYDFSWRTYRSELAKRKKNNNIKIVEI